MSREGEALGAFREGTARLVPSVRTSPQLARITLTTVQGKRWQRIHVVDHPLSEYLRYEWVGYVESQAAGLEVRIAIRSTDPALNELRKGFSLFEPRLPDAYALVMRYDETPPHWPRAHHAGDDVHVGRATARSRSGTPRN